MTGSRKRKKKLWVIPLGAAVIAAAAAGALVLRALEWEQPEFGNCAVEWKRV